MVPQGFPRQQPEPGHGPRYRTPAADDNADRQAAVPPASRNRSRPGRSSGWRGCHAADPDRPAHRWPACQSCPHAVAQDVSGNLKGAGKAHITSARSTSKVTPKEAARSSSAPLTAKKSSCSPKATKPRVQALFRQFGQRKLFGHINVGKLKQTAAACAFFRLVTATFNRLGASREHMMVRLEMGLTAHG